MSYLLLGMTERYTRPYLLGVHSTGMNRLVNSENITHALRGKYRVPHDAPIWIFYPFPWWEVRDGTFLTRSAGIRQGWRRWCPSQLASAIYLYEYLCCVLILYVYFYLLYLLFCMHILCISYVYFDLFISTKAFAPCEFLCERVSVAF